MERWTCKMWMDSIVLVFKGIWSYVIFSRMMMYMLCYLLLGVCLLDHYALELMYVKVRIMNYFYVKNIYVWMKRLKCNGLKMLRWWKIEMCVCFIGFTLAINSDSLKLTRSLVPVMALSLGRCIYYLIKTWFK